MTPDEQAQALAVAAPGAPTASQQALYLYWLDQRYQEQQRLHGWPPPEPEGPEPTPLRLYWP